MRGRYFAMLCQHRVDRARNFDVTVQNRRAQFFILVGIAQHFELVMQVEYHGRPDKPARRAAGLRVKPDNEKCLAAKAERKLRMIGIMRHARVLFLAQPIVLVA